MSETQTTLRDALSAGLDAIEASTPVAESSPVTTSEVIEPKETSEAKIQRERDETGRFASKQEAKTPEIPVTTQQVQRPSTWKKEYWPLYDKLANGQALSLDEAKKLAEYTNQRENEFKSGVSTYRAEAEKSKELQDAIAPFMPDLQKYNIQPGQWIANLGRAHHTLALGSPAEKVQMFKRLAHEYQVPLSAVAEGAPALQSDPQIQWLTQQLNEVKTGWTQFKTLQEKQAEEMTNKEIEKFGTDASHPHFETVRVQMAELLRAGLAHDLQTAYDKAVRLNDDVWTQHQQATLSAAQANQKSTQAVAKAKAAAVSPKSASPSVSTNSGAKGLRAQLAEQVNAAFGHARV